MHSHGRLLASLQQHPFLRLFGTLCVLWLLLNLPLLLGTRVLPWDAIDQFYPTVYFNVHSLRLGLAPWWNPYVYSGYPQIADPQGMLFSPLLMAWMLLREAPGASWFVWGVLLHMLMGGTAMLALLRRSGANAFGALTGATVFIAGGVAAARLEHVPIVLAYAYAPVVLLALRHFMANPGWRRGLLLGLAAGALVTQLVQLSYLIALMTIGYAAIASVLHWHGYDGATRWRWCAGMLLAILAALALGLPQLLLSWAYTSLSNRSALPLAAAADASLDLRALLSFIDPNAWHALRGTYAGPASRVEAYLYLGAVPSLLLAGIGAAWCQPRQRRQLLFFAVVALLACLYMLGVHTPFYGWLYSWLPGIAQFRRPSDAAYLLNFSLAMFIGLAASHFRLDSRRHVSVLLGIAACWLLLSSLQMRDVDVRWQVKSIAAAVLALLALWRLQRSGTTRRTTLWLLLVLVADYRCFSLNGAFNEAHDNARRFMHDTTADFLVAQLRPSSGMPTSRIEAVDAGMVWDNNVVLRELASTQGYNPLRYALYDRWYGARESGNLARAHTLYNPAPDSALSNLLGVEYLVKGHAAGTPAWSPPSGYELVFVGKKTDVWRNRHAYPRLLTPTQARLLAVDQQPSPAAFAATDFHHTLWLTPRDESDRRSGETSAARSVGQLQITETHATPTRLTIRTRAAAPGWLVLSELDFPGWQAEADGTRLPIHRANGMFRAICMPAGAHTLRVAFHPWQMVAAAWRQAHP